MVGLQTWERMLSLDSDGVRGELVRVMSDGQTGDRSTAGVALWPPTPSKVNTGRGVMELTRTSPVSQ